MMQTAPDYMVVAVSCPLQAQQTCRLQKHTADIAVLVGLVVVAVVGMVVSPTGVCL